MKNQIYHEMCSFLANEEQLLQRFKDFHEKNKEAINYLDLFEAEYGVMYRTYKGKPTPPPIQNSDYTQQPTDFTTGKKDIQDTLHQTAKDFVSYINKPTPDPKAEKILKIVALISLASGLIGTLILLRTIAFIDSGLYYFFTDHSFSFSGFILSFGPALGGVISWAVLNVLRNISLNLWEIKNKRS